MTPMTRRRWPFAAPLVLLALAGCGGFGDDDVTNRVVVQGVVTKQQVDRQPADSPQRATLEWWRALQYRNPVEAARFYSADQHMTTARMNKYIAPADSVLNRRPIVVDTEISGDKAIVRLLLEQTTKNANGRTDRERRAQAFNLVRENGEWKLAENLYLGTIYKTYRAFTAPAREQQKQQQQQQQNSGK
jgi:hypothetical protein